MPVILSFYLLRWPPCLLLIIIFSNFQRWPPCLLFNFCEIYLKVAAVPPPFPPSPSCTPPPLPARPDCTGQPGDAAKSLPQRSVKRENVTAFFSPSLLSSLFFSLFTFIITFLFRAHRRNSFHTKEIGSSPSLLLRNRYSRGSTNYFIKFIQCVI